MNRNTILVANDNNYPGGGGRSSAPDNNEILVLELGTTLNLDPRVGLAGLQYGLANDNIAIGNTDGLSA